MNTMFRAAVGRRNVVFSPHAVVRALLVLAGHLDESERARLLHYLGQPASLEELAAQTAAADARLASPLSPRFKYDARVAVALPHGVADGAPTALDRLLGAVRSESADCHIAIRSEINASIGNVPIGDARSVFGTFHGARGSTRLHSVEKSSAQDDLFYAQNDDYRAVWWYADASTALRPDATPTADDPQQRADVTLWSPRRDVTVATALVSLPLPQCAPDTPLRQVSHAQVALRVPLWSVASIVDLNRDVPELRPWLAAPNSESVASACGATVVSRESLAMGPKLQLNYNGDAVEAANTGELRGGLAFDKPVAVTLDHPFVVTVNDAGSGAILYVALITDPTHEAAKRATSEVSQ